MLRRSSIKLVDVFGIRIGVDASWFLVLFLMIFLLSGSFRQELHSSDGVAYLTTVATVLVLFGSLIVHELGHAIAARRQGIEVLTHRAVPVRRADADEPRCRISSRGVQNRGRRSAGDILLLAGLPRRRSGDRWARIASLTRLAWSQSRSLRCYWHSAGCCSGTCYCCSSTWCRRFPLMGGG